MSGSVAANGRIRMRACVTKDFLSTPTPQAYATVTHEIAVRFFFKQIVLHFFFDHCESLRRSCTFSQCLGHFALKTNTSVDTFLV